MSKKPMKLAAIDGALELPAGTVQTWAGQPGFPLSGAESALLDDVMEWARAAGCLPDRDSPAAESESDPPAAESASVPLADVRWLDVRIPIVKDTAVRPPSRVMQSVRLAPRDKRLRRAIGMVHAGCNESNQRLTNGKACDNFSASYRWIYEQIARAVDAQCDGLEG